MQCDVGGHIGILNTDCSISIIQKNKEKNIQTYSNIFCYLFEFAFLPHDCCLSHFNFLHTFFFSTFSNYVGSYSDKWPVAPVNTLLPHTVVN